MNVVDVKYKNTLVGAVFWEPSRKLAVFEYSEDFCKSPLPLSPIKMPVTKGAHYYFPENKNWLFHGLPGLLIGSLPESFGNTILSKYQNPKGINFNKLSYVDRLSYVGIRGMGALEYFPNLFKSKNTDSHDLNLSNLTDLVLEVLNTKNTIKGNLRSDKANAIESIIKITSSAGGARAKAVILFNPLTKEISGGYKGIRKGFEHYLIKIDGVHSDFDLFKNYGKIEYAYYLMAKKAGINISNSELITDGNKSHFLTRRFDREDNGEKHHILTWACLEHYSDSSILGYENLFDTLDKLKCDKTQFKELFRRMIFNVLTKNTDDHTRNFSFIMDNNGDWKLSPAYDLVYTYQKDDLQNCEHKLSVNGERFSISIEDIFSVAKTYDIPSPSSIFREVKNAVNEWTNEAGLPLEQTKAIHSTFSKIDL